jgi:hypothetical protein
MKTNLIMLALALLPAASFASDFPDSFTATNEENIIWYCEELGPTCEPSKEIYEIVKIQTILDAKRTCYFYYGSVDNCDIHEDTYRVKANIRIPGLPKFGTRNGMNIHGSVLVTRKK